MEERGKTKKAAPSSLTCLRAESDRQNRFGSVR